MILDLQRFTDRERPRWLELEALLDRMEAGAGSALDLDGALRLHYLYQKAGADLARVRGQSAAPELRRYLEALVARAYSAIYAHDAAGAAGFSPKRFLLRDFPAVFRRRIAAFWLALAVTLAGGAAGGALVRWEPEAKSVLLPYEHLAGNPADRVAEEERTAKQSLGEDKAYFSAFLMTNNIKVAILALVTGFAFGIGPFLLLFYNGAVLGAVVYDYLAAGQGRFLAGWLLPHGSFEIPAILLAGQAGFVIGAQVLRGYRSGNAVRGMRAAAPDAATLIGGIAVMLVWAGIVEAFFSQYHEPVLPYAAKIAFGCAELIALIAWLGWAGRRGEGGHARA